jgi:hypothetical protein
MRPSLLAVDLAVAVMLASAAVEADSRIINGDSCILEGVATESYSSKGLPVPEARPANFPRRKKEFLKSKEDEGDAPFLAGGRSRGASLPAKGRGARNRYDKISPRPKRKNCFLCLGIKGPDPKRKPTRSPMSWAGRFIEGDKAG